MGGEELSSLLFDRTGLAFVARLASATSPTSPNKAPDARSAAPPRRCHRSNTPATSPGPQTAPTTSDASATANSRPRSAATVFGVLRGLETFAQLVESDPLHRTVPLAAPHPAGSISDAPRFPYRGLMMDLSRHFYPIPFIEHTIDAMVASKLNVLHLHLTDDTSFPVESTVHPELARNLAEAILLRLRRGARPLRRSQPLPRRVRPRCRRCPPPPCCRR